MPGQLAPQQAKQEELQEELEELVERQLHPLQHSGSLSVPLLVLPEQLTGFGLRFCSDLPAC